MSHGLIPEEHGRQRREPAVLPALAELSDPFVVRLMQLLRDQAPAIEALEHLETS